MRSRSSLAAEQDCWQPAEEPAPPATEGRDREQDARGPVSVPAPLEWNPSFSGYRARCLRQLKARAALPARAGLSAVPAGWPHRLAGPQAWAGPALAAAEYVVPLTAAAVDEVRRALAHFTALELPVSAVSRRTFPLPLLGPMLAALSATLYHGRGFFVLRGLDPRDYSAHENIVLYAGIACYVAEKRGRQDEHNNYLLHLVDLGAEVAPDSVRQAPYSNVPQPYHTDTGDILALYVLETAAKGGTSLLASTATIYNELAASRPDHLQTLSSPWPFDSFARPDDGSDVPLYRMRPLLFHVDGKVILSFSRRPLVGSAVSPRTPGIPALTEEQAEALDAVHFSAARNAVVIQHQRGDMQFWNNLSLVHAREGFTDTAGQQRHLVRLWLRDEQAAWKLPAALQPAWDTAYGDEPERRPERWPVDPIRDFHHVTTQRRSSGHS